jgi:serine/threonine protein kinase
LKVISKAFILKHRKQRLVRNERDIMVDLPHPLLAKLQATFETKQFIVFVIDYYPGG